MDFYLTTSPSPFPPFQITCPDHYNVRNLISFQGLQNAVDRQLFRFHRYDFLWKEDMHALYQAFVDMEPSAAEFHREVKRLQSIEKEICAIPDLLIIGSVCLNTTPVKDSLHGLAVAWKMKYSTELHEIAKVLFSAKNSEPTVEQD